MATSKSLAQSAFVSVWGKGFRVSCKTQEFQRIVPPESNWAAGTGACELELRLEAFQDWGRLLTPFYTLDQSELSAEKCLLLSESELCVVRACKTLDRHHRPSIVFVAATSPIEWEATDVGLTAECCDALATQLAAAYAGAFEANPESVETQLRGGEFLPDREFALSRESAEGNVFWSRVLEAVKEWEGVRGVASKRMASLGANVLFGTRHEAEASSLRDVLDGYYDVRDGRIKNLSDGIRPWMRVHRGAGKSAPPPASEPGSEPPTESPPIEVSLAGIDHSLRIFAGLFDMGLRFFLGGGPRRPREEDERKKGKKKKDRED